MVLWLLLRLRLWLRLRFGLIRFRLWLGLMLGRDLWWFCGKLSNRRHDGFGGQTGQLGPREI